MLEHHFSDNINGLEEKSNIYLVKSKSFTIYFAVSHFQAFSLSVAHTHTLTQVIYGLCPCYE